MQTTDVKNSRNGSTRRMSSIKRGQSLRQLNQVTYALFRCLPQVSGGAQIDSSNSTVVPSIHPALRALRTRSDSNYTALCRSTQRHSSTVGSLNVVASTSLFHERHRQGLPLSRFRATCMLSAVISARDFPHSSIDGSGLSKMRFDSRLCVSLQYKIAYGLKPRFIRNPRLA
jgi:hypothetical protein